jgi:hypothetical protein
LVVGPHPIDEDRMVINDPKTDFLNRISTEPFSPSKAIFSSRVRLKDRAFPAWRESLLRRVGRNFDAFP